MIIPWTCHVCLQKFDKYRGGVCSRCKRATCSEHLKLVGYTSKDEPAKSEHICCSECVRPGETATRLRRSQFAQFAWLRRWGL